MLSVKNFEKFQHYKDRSPVWIKLYRSLLRDYEFAQLPDSARGQLLMIWLLASEMGNQLPNDAEWIKRQINATEPVNLAILIDAGFLVDCDSNHDASESASDMVLAQRREREEKEGEGEGEGEVASPAKPRSARRPTQCDDEFLAELQANPAYAMLDVRRLYHKMTAWCQNNGKQPTRGRLINWLNREDKPMTANSKPPSNAYVGAATPLPDTPVDELLSKTAEFMDTYIDMLIDGNDLIHVGQEYDAIVKRGGAKLEWEIRCVAWYELHKQTTTEVS